MTFKVDTTIPYGNACDVSISEEAGMPVVGFAADPHGGPESLWFCFRLKRTPAVKKSPGQVKLVLKHSQNMLGASKAETMRPVIRYFGKDWERMGPGAAEGLPDGRRLMGWVVEAPASHADVAFCYPYGRPEQDALVRDGKGYWRADTIGVSQGTRPLIRLSNDPGQAGSTRPGLYLVARQHSGETPGSWVLDGFLRHMASAGDAAPLVWAVPLSNIDGVEQGDYGKDNFPYDMNRAWGAPPMRHETLVIQRDMQRWKGRCKPLFGLDFHGPGASESEGAYFYIPNPEKFPEHHKMAAEWAGTFGRAMGPEYASKTIARVAKYASRWETPTFAAYCCSPLGVGGFTLETPYALANETLLTRQAYQEIGSRMAAAVIERGCKRTETA